MSSSPFQNDPRPDPPTATLPELPETWRPAGQAPRSQRPGAVPRPPLLPPLPKGAPGVVPPAPRPGERRLTPMEVFPHLRPPEAGGDLGSYHLIEEIGLGGMGRVFLARSPWDGLVALKTIRERRYELIRRLEREAQLGMSLEHPHIIRVLDCNLTVPWPYVVMEYLEGCTLEELPGFGHPMPEIAVMALLEGIVEALLHTEELHTIHRDVKPGNIFLTFAGEAKLMDFGLALGPLGPRITSREDLLGTIAYMAPEQIRHGTNSHQGDIYSLGITAYQLLTGRTPYSGATIPALVKQIMAGNAPKLRGRNRAVSAAAESIILKMMAADSSDRYPSFAAVRKDLSLYGEFSGMNAIPEYELRQSLRLLHNRPFKTR